MALSANDSPKKSDISHLAADLHTVEVQIRELSIAQEPAYDAWVRCHAHGTLWQSLEWKRFQESLGRMTRLFAAIDGERILASALVIIDQTTLGYETWDIPRGPLRPESSSKDLERGLLEAIIAEAKTSKCLTLFCSPLNALEPSLALFAPSSRHIQPEASIIVDLTQPEEALLVQMHQKGRYNLRLAQKHGVTVTRSEDIDAFYALLKQTSQRDQFQNLPKKQYENFLRGLPGSFLLLAFSTTSKEPIAGLMGVNWGKTGIYYYGASDYAHRALMAPYLLQWEAMRHCKEQGCEAYDLLGVAPPDADASHPWKGISSFKEKFGGTLVTYPPEQQIILRPVLASLLRMKRKILG